MKYRVNFVRSNSGPQIFPYLRIVFSASVTTNRFRVAMERKILYSGKNAWWYPRRYHWKVSLKIWEWHDEDLLSMIARSTLRPIDSCVCASRSICHSTFGRIVSIVIFCSDIRSRFAVTRATVNFSRYVVYLRFRYYVGCANSLACRARTESYLIRMQYGCIWSAACIVLAFTIVATMPISCWEYSTMKLWLHSSLSLFAILI